MPLLYQQCARERPRRRAGRGRAPPAGRFERVAIGGVNNASIRAPGASPLSTPAVPAGRQCVALSKSGARCRNRACETNRCGPHLRAQYGVKIYDSAHGRGLATTRAIPADTPIAPMGGKPLRPVGAPVNSYNRDWPAQDPRDIVKPYQYDVPHHVVDAYITEKVRGRYTRRDPTAAEESLDLTGISSWGLLADRPGYMVWRKLLPRGRAVVVTTVHAVFDAAYDRGAGSYANDPNNVSAPNWRAQYKKTGNAVIGVDLEYVRFPFKDRRIWLWSRPRPRGSTYAGIPANVQITTAYGKNYWGKARWEERHRTYPTASRDSPSVNPTTRCTLR